jgi:GH24 family phage-related lysozyme (muramidase)
LDWEVGGGKAYYDQFLKHPVVPDPAHTQSGVTLGIGWDCGQNTQGCLAIEWGAYLEGRALEDLKRVMGLKGMEAKNALAQVEALAVEWETALDQFRTHTVPRHWGVTCAAFPGAELTPQGVQEALLCLVFNRGAGMEGERRREMREIRDAVSKGEWEDIPASIRGMKRLWPDTPGLRNRREAEAVFIEEALGEEGKG